MKPMALVQYELLYERFLVEWMRDHLYLPDVDDFLRGISAMAPEGLGKPLSIPLDDLHVAYTRLWWNYLFLSHAISGLQEGVDREMRVLDRSRWSLGARLNLLQKKVETIAARDTQVLYSFYDTFGDTRYIENTDAWVDTVAGEVRLPASSISTLNDLFEVARMDGGLVLRSPDAVRVNGMRVGVRGSAVVSISAVTAVGSVDLFRSEMSGESDVEFPPVDATEIVVSAEGNGYVNSAVPFVREYQPEATLVSVQGNMVTTLRGSNANMVRLKVDADTPPGTSVEGYVRFITSAPGEWKLAARPLPLPVQRSVTRVTDQWQHLEPDGVYRNGQLFASPEGEVFVGRDQWTLRALKMDVEDVDRLAGNRSISLDEVQFENDSSFLGFIRYVESHPRYDSQGRLTGHSPVTPSDNDDILFLFPGSDPAFYLQTGMLPAGSVYRFSTWFYSELDEDLPIRLRLDFVPDAIGVSVSVNGQYVLVGRMNGSSTLTEQMGASVRVRRGWNRVNWYVALARAVDVGISLKIGRSSTSAYPHSFEQCSPYMLRYDSERTDMYYSWHSTTEGHRLELAIPCLSVQVGSIRSRPPNVDVEVPDGDVVNAVQVMLKLSTQNSSVTPVVKSYSLEVL